MNSIRRLCSAFSCRTRPAPLRHPLDPGSAVRVTSYPLTRQEVRILALHWTQERIDTTACCRLTASCGTTDLWIFDFTAARYKAATAILGEAEMDRVYAEASNRVREKIGDDVWAAYQEKNPIWSDDECDTSEPFEGNEVT